jgi:hypothetical protein
MAFFLRYTDKLEIDLDRKTSVHLCDGPEFADDFIEEIGHVQILNGLCGYPIHVEDEEDAIDESIESVQYRRNYYDPNASESGGRIAYLFEGTYSGDCIDGDLFIPTRVIKNITEIA